MASTRSGEDRREGWGPQCAVHEKMDTTVERMGETVLELKSALRWIMLFSGGIFTVMLAAAGILIPMLYSYNKSVNVAIADHQTRITSIEKWVDMREKILPTGSERIRAALPKE